MTASIDGIGGIFFNANDPDALAVWYRETLGIGHIWSQSAGPTVFAPFAKDTDYFDRPEQQRIIDFGVSDLTALTDQLKTKGIEVITNPDWDSEVGRFARIHDPEGNPIELWEPAAP